MESQSIFDHHCILKTWDSTGHISRNLQVFAEYTDWE